ncbi:MAG: CHAD domain-containing protein, partial [Bradyrhizobium sp.]|nr:CHAD domain-containing protein [Bradyrhizobium sp.]
AFRLLADGAKSGTEISVYFDTDKQELRRNGVMLRVRRSGNRRVQTIKAAPDSWVLERDEWECEIPGDTPELDLARGTALEPLLCRKLERQLKPVFTTKVQRRSCCLNDDNYAVVISLDKGRIDAGQRSRPLCEIELELKRGPQETLFDLARKLVDALPAQLAVESKSERGYALVDQHEVAPVKAARVELRAEMNARDGFRAISRACLRQIIGNVPALRAGDAEGVHQMRVGLRRLRAAISLFADILTDRQTEAVKRELRWLARALTPARELEVLVRRVIDPAKQRRMRGKGIARIAQDIGRQHAEALEHAQDAIESGRFRRLLIELAAWIETGQWRKPQDELVSSRGEALIAEFASAELARRWKKLRKRGKALPKLDPAHRHKLRIQGKKLRYAGEFFASLFSGKRAAHRRKILLGRLEDLQDCLGDLNDIVVHERLMSARADLGQQRRADRRRAFAAGLLTGLEDARLDTVLARAVDACGKLIKAKPFW